MRKEPLIKEQRYFIATMTVHEGGYVFLSANQKFENHYKKDYPQYQYSQVRLFVRLLITTE